MMICFSGTDGAGKSTQIDLLSQLFQRNGRRYKVIWARGGYTPLFSFLKRTLQIIFGKKVPKSGPSEVRDKIFKNAIVAKIWLWIAIADLFLFYGVYARVLALLGFVIICDRYVEDTEIDFQRNFPNIFDSSLFLWKLLIWTIPTAKYSFLLHVPVEVTMARSKQKQEPFPDSAETLKFRLSSYLNEKNFPSSKYDKIDCRSDVKSIHLMIVNRIKVSL